MPVAVHVPWPHVHHIGNDALVPNAPRNRRSAALLALGAAIRDLRSRRGLSQEELALRADVDRSYMGRVERGDNNVALLTLARIAKALGVSLAKLIAAARL